MKMTLTQGFFLKIATPNSKISADSLILHEKK